jgi:hypothetical protein
VWSDDDYVNRNDVRKERAEHKVFKAL